jgi:hypothetical protein
LVPGRCAALTGSRPTATSPLKLSDPSPATSKIARRPSTVLTAESSLPAADRRRGWVWPLSKFRKSTSGGMAMATTRVAGLGSPARKSRSAVTRLPLSSADASRFSAVVACRRKVKTPAGLKVGFTEAPAVGAAAPLKLQFSVSPPPEALPV